MITILTQYNTFDKFFRQRVVSDYLQFESQYLFNHPNHNNNIGNSEIDLEQSNAYKSLHPNSEKLPNNRNPKDSIASPWLSYAPSPFSQGGTYRNTHLHINEDEYTQQ